MDDNNGYAVFFFPQALEALGEAIKPYLQDGPAGAHVVCNTVDTGGALIEMSLLGKTADGRAVELELMVPGSMVRMIVSAQSDAGFGFGPRVARPPVATVPAAAETAPASSESPADESPAESAATKPAATEPAAPPASTQDATPAAADEAVAKTADKSES